MRAAVEHELVLPADEVDVSEHGRGVGRPRGEHPLALGEHARPVGRAVEHDDQLGPTGAEAGYGTGRAPGVLADDDAHANAVHDREEPGRGDRPGGTSAARRRRRSWAGAPCARRRAPCRRRRRRRRCTDRRRRRRSRQLQRTEPVSRRSSRARFEVALDERRVHEQILGRVARDDELREHGEIGPCTFGLGEGSEHFGDVAVEVAYHCVELAQGHTQAAHDTSVPHRPG